MNIEAKELSKIYGSGESRVVALDQVNLEIASSDFISIMGPSGSGKSTLLHLLSGLDKPTSGSLTYDRKDIYRFNDKELSAFRRQNLGFVFQDFNLLDTFSIQDNIFLPLVLAGKAYNEMRSSLMPIAEKLGINEILAKYPYEVSGGQKQRAAVARALITNPQMILADEPTGALDSKAAQSLLSMFQNINQEGQTILMVTHSIKAASCAKRVLFIKDGQVFHQIYKGSGSDEEMYQKISDTLTVITTGGVKHE